MAIKVPDRQELEGMDLGLLGESVGSAVRLLRNLLTSRVVAAFEPYGMRTGTFSTLALISANPGCSQSEIARQIGADKSIVVAIVDHLESAGFATRQRSREDRRRNVLTLTQKGEALVDEMRALGHMAEQPIRDALSPDEVVQLIALTRRAVDALMAAEPG